MPRRVIAGLAWLGAALVVISAPFAALADAPFSPGGWQALPGYAALVHDTLRPAFEFASPEWVLRIWEAPLALGFALIAASAGPLVMRARVNHPKIGYLILIAAALLGMLALGTGSEAALGTNSPLGFLYFLATPLAPLGACAAGALALRARALNRGSAWSLTAAPVASLGSLAVLPQFPAGTGLGLALAWAIAVLVGTRSPGYETEPVKGSPGG